jgi:hypothetical protein
VDVSVARLLKRGRAASGGGRALLSSQPAGCRTVLNNFDPGYEKRLLPGQANARSLFWLWVTVQNIQRSGRPFTVRTHCRLGSAHHGTRCVLLLLDCLFLRDGDGDADAEGHLALGGPCSLVATPLDASY